ncbi:hypothetical protein D1AOALGA4SA_7672 [Olavius algarvensis Delta 1 endosymbiont]|nr:hypothetical protein D1AOALGA4SA_7672 [Olavius algarvensis Delta 1 endosymbiont]
MNIGMTNVECRLTNDGFASLSLFKIDRIHYSTFDLPAMPRNGRQIYTGIRAKTQR